MYPVLSLSRPEKNSQSDAGTQYSLWQSSDGKEKPQNTNIFKNYST